MEVDVSKCLCVCMCGLGFFCELVGLWVCGVFLACTLRVRVWVSFQQSEFFAALPLQCIKCLEFVRMDGRRTGLHSGKLRELNIF